MTYARRTCLDLILGPQGLSVLFQPIMERHERSFRLWSVESLVRGPSGSTVEPAEILFDYVRRKREEVRVDRACVAAVCAAASQLPSTLDFSINIHAATLSRDPGFVEHLLDQAHCHGVAPSRITIEIVEHAREWAGREMRGALDALRHTGVHVALDDIGLGQSNYRMVVDCRPDYLKIERYFARGVHADPYRQAVFQSVSTLASRIGAHVVAEGIEDRADLETVGALGVSLFQGFLFQPPVPASELQLEDVCRQLAAGPGPESGGGMREHRWTG